MANENEQQGDWQEDEVAQWTSTEGRHMIRNAGAHAGVYAVGADAGPAGGTGVDFGGCGGEGWCEQIHHSAV